MSSIVFSNIFRFLFLVLLQVLVLRSLAMEWSGFPYLNILVYPLFIFLLPLGTRRWVQFLLAFAIGLTIDIFYDSPGIHASAAVFIAYLRPYVLRWLEPRGGYNINYSPTKSRMGGWWFFQYSALLMFPFCLFYFSVEAFNFADIGDILLKSVMGFVFSMIVILIITFIFNPKD